MSDIKEKIRSLIRLSLSGNPHEAALAFERAKHLASKNNIDIRDFLHTDPGDDLQREPASDAATVTTDEYPVGLRLRNTWECEGQNSFIWYIFLTDSGSGALARVKHVTYVLHETFSSPIERVADPHGGFRFGARGWGIFTIRAQVTMKNGMLIDLAHTLELRHNPRSGTSA